MREFPNFRELFGCFVMYGVLLVCFLAAVKLFAVLFGG